METEIVDVVVVIKCNVNRGSGKEVKGVGIKGWGSCYHARDQSGWGFATMSKTLAFQVSMGFFSSFSQGVWLIINCVLCKYKQDFVCRLKINHAWSVSSSCV
jgi:hypothetical protein